MISTNDIRDALNRRLLELWPTRTVYVDVCPVDFSRPSCWLQVARDDRRMANRFLVKRDLEVKVTLYDEQDDHYETSWSRLAADQDQLLTRLSEPLAVDGRRLPMTARGLPREPDRAVVSISLIFFDVSPRREETVPLMEHAEFTDNLRS